MKSGIQIANVFSENTVCQPNQTASARKANADHSTIMSPSVQPVPQWLVPFITIAANGWTLSFA